MRKSIFVIKTTPSVAFCYDSPGRLTQGVRVLLPSTTWYSNGHRVRVQLTKKGRDKWSKEEKREEGKNEGRLCRRKVASSGPKPKMPRPFPLQRMLWPFSVLKPGRRLVLCVPCRSLLAFDVYLSLRTWRTAILSLMGPKSTCLKSVVISEERKIDLTPVKFLFCFKQFIKKYFMYWTEVG